MMKFSISCKEGWRVEAGVRSCRGLFWLIVFLFCFVFFTVLFIYLNYVIYFNWGIITLQYCDGFAIHQHESATGIHVSPCPILNAPPKSLPILSLWLSQSTGFVFFVFFFFNLILFYFLTLQYCIGFAIYQNESATGIHVFPILLFGFLFQF